MSNRNPIIKGLTQVSSCFTCRSQRQSLSKALLAVSTVLALSVLPMGSAQASSGATLWDAPGISLSETQLVRNAAGNFTVLAIIVKPDRDPPRQGGGDGPKRPEKRAVVSVHG